jgi:hypothetical protein
MKLSPITVAVPLAVETIGFWAVGVLPVANGEVDWGTKHVPPGQVAVLKVPVANVGTNPMCPVSLGAVPGFPLFEVSGGTGLGGCGAACAAAMPANAPAVIIPPMRVAPAIFLKFVRSITMISF